MLRIIPALGAVFVAVFALAACGGSSNDIPGNAVARVGDTSITKDDFNHWMRVIAVSAAGAQDQKTAGTVVVPDPPDYAACVANKKKTAPKPAKGQPRTTDAQYKTQCEQEYSAMRDQAMSFLISSQWLQDEAAKEGIKVSDADVQKEFDKTKKQSFPKEADYQKFLKTSGMTQEDVLFRVKTQLLSQKIRDKVIKGKDQATDAQIAAYYNKNKQRFAQPETRDLRIVLTKTEAKAGQAKQALQSGQGWKAVAKQYSIDQASKSQGGALQGVTKGQQEKALDTAVFGAKKGQLVGPVKTQFGWYVFEVSKVTPASQQSLDQAKPTIKQLLASQGQQKALDTFVKDFTKRYKAETNCRKGYATQDCKNAPKVKTNTTPTAAAPTTTAGQ